MSDGRLACPPSRRRPAALRGARGARPHRRADRGTAQAAWAPTRCRAAAPARLAPVCAPVRQPSDLHPVRRRLDGRGPGPPWRRRCHPGGGAGQRADRNLPGRPGGALDGRACGAWPPCRCACCAMAARAWWRRADLVPGDILLLAAGDAVAADARLLEESQLQAAEAALTGESVPVSKSAARLPEATGLADRRNMVYSGTHITAGRALAVVVATGPHTEVGRIAGLTAGRRRTPDAAAAAHRPIRPRARCGGIRLVRPGRAARPVARAAPVRGVDGGHQPDGLHGARGTAGGDDHRAGRGHAAHGRTRRDHPPAVRRRDAGLDHRDLQRQDRHADAQRDDGDGTVAARRGDAGSRASTFPASATGRKGSCPRRGARVDARAPALASLLEAAVLCNDAQLLPPEDERNGWAVVGDPTEGALLVLAAKAGIDLEALRQLAPRDARTAFRFGRQADGHPPQAARRRAG